MSLDLPPLIVGQPRTYGELDLLLEPSRKGRIVGHSYIPERMKRKIKRKKKKHKLEEGEIQTP